MPSRLPLMGLLLVGCGMDDATSKSLPQPTDPSATADASADPDASPEALGDYVPLEPDPDWVMPAMPMSRSEGRLQIVDLYLSPEDSLMWGAVQAVLEDWDQCVAQHVEACGYLVLGAKNTGQGLEIKKSPYAERGDGLVADCMIAATDGLPLSQGTPERYEYIAAIGVAPTPEELSGCIEGVEAPTEEYLRSR